MKTPLRLLVCLLLVSGTGINSVSGQISSCMTVINGQNKVCEGFCSTLNAFFNTPSICTGFTYQWSPGGQSTSSIVVCPSVSTTYTVMACCTGPNTCCDTAVFSVLVTPTPTVTVSGADTICIGQGTSLCANNTASNGASYLWMPGGQTTACIYENPTSTTTYTVIVTDANGCTGSAHFLLNVINCAPGGCTASVSGQTNICIGGCATLNAMFSTNLNCPSLSYQWLPGGQTTSSVIVCPTSNTSYSVIICCNESTNCCDTATVAVNVGTTPPAVMISGADTICSGQGTNLCTNTIAGASYLWMPGGQATACIYAAPTTTTTYTVWVTDANGCSGSATFTLTVIPCTGGGCTALVNGQNQICAGGCTTLNAALSSTANCIAMSYQWFPGGQTTASIVVCPTSSTTYIATVCCIGPNTSCCDTASFTVNVNPLPAVAITGPATICIGQSTTLCTNTIGTSYAWMPGGQTSPCAWAMPTVTTTYTVTVTDTNGCSNTATHTLTVLQCPTGIIENIFSSQAKIFPNPFQEYSIVQIHDAQLIPCELKIYNLLGIEVKNIRIESSETKISRDNLPSGIYYYRLDQKGKIHGNGKLVIE